MLLKNLHITSAIQTFVRSIDIRMLPSKVSFFLLFSAIGAIVPFINIFLVSVGLTVREAGIISGVSILWMIIGPIKNIILYFFEYIVITIINLFNFL